MKTIYICSEFFAPYQNIGAIKFTKIAKFFSRNREYKVVVFTRKNFDENDILLEEDLQEIQNNRGEVYFIDAGKRYYRQYRKNWRNAIFMAHSAALSKLPAYYNFYYYMSNRISAKKFVKEALKVIDEKRIPRPDYLISTYDDWGGHYLAAELKEKWKEKVTWISDFRDPVGAAVKKGVFRKLCDKYSLEVTEKSDCTTVVSEGMLNSLRIHPGTKTVVATNGFDQEDYEKVLRDKKKLHLVYTGSLYHKEQTLEPIFQAIRELIDEKKIEEKNITIDYAGQYGAKVYREVCKYHLGKIYNDWGEVSRYCSILLQDRGDILLTSVWNLKEHQGVIAGKTLGYFMLKKPIIAIVGGNMGNSNMKQLVRETNCGFCYEKANGEEDYKKLKQVLLNYYNQKMGTGNINQKYSPEVEKYNLVNVTKVYEKLCER